MRDLHVVRGGRCVRDEALISVLLCGGLAQWQLKADETEKQNNYYSGGKRARSIA